MKRVKSCNSCTLGITNNLNKDILCRIKGVVSRDFACIKYKAIVIAKDRVMQKDKCADCEFYIIDAANSTDPVIIGFCQLFTVRKFNGENKNACSKFNRRSELIVS